jgi:hypothetical protein
MKTSIPGVTIAATPRKQSSSLDAIKVIIAPLMKNNVLCLEKMTSFKTLKSLKKSVSRMNLETRGSEQSWITATTEKTLSTTAPDFKERL